MEMLSSVSETALITLRSRVIESEKENALIRDPMSGDVLKQMYAVIPGEIKNRVLNRKLSPSMTVYIALRARKYDAYAKEFLKKHPKGIVVNLGCGFDTRFWRISVNPAQYIEIDLPGVISAKKQILGKAAEYRMTGCSVLDPKWIAEISAIQKTGILFLAEGLFMYLPKDDVIATFKRLADSFTHSEIVFEVVNEKYTKGLMKKMVQAKMKRRLGTDAGSSYDFGVNKAKEIESFGKGLRVLEEWSYFEDDDLRPGILKLFKNWKMFTRTQWTIRAAIG